MSGDSLRKHCVAVVIRHGHVLLVEDRGKYRYSRLGGGVHWGERYYRAVARELYEETGLKANKTHYQDYSMSWSVCITV
jgi:ADP-ribose pyrophosphatase YjhB (NUDIX family)